MRHYVQKSQATAISHPRTPALTWLVSWCLLMALAVGLTTRVWADTNVSGNETISSDQGSTVYNLDDTTDTITITNGGSIEGFVAQGGSASSMLSFPSPTSTISSDPQSYTDWTVWVNNKGTTRQALGESFTNMHEYTENFTFGLFYAGLSLGASLETKGSQSSSNSSPTQNFFYGYNTSNTFFYNNVPLQRSNTETQPILYCNACDNFTFYNDQYDSSSNTGGKIMYNTSEPHTMVQTIGGSQTIYNYGQIFGGIGALKIFGSLGTTIYNQPGAIISTPVTGALAPISLYSSSYSASSNFSLLNWGTVGNSTYSYPVVYGPYAQTGFIGNFSGGSLLAGSGIKLFDLTYTSNFDVYNEGSIDINGDGLYIQSANGTRLINRGTMTKTSSATGYVMNCAGGNDNPRCDNTQLINSGAISSNATSGNTMNLKNINNANSLINRLGGSISDTNSIINGGNSKTAIVNYGDMASDSSSVFNLYRNYGSDVVNHGNIVTANSNVWAISDSNNGSSLSNHLLNSGSMSAEKNTINAYPGSGFGFNYPSKGAGYFDTALRILNSGTIEATSTSEGTNTLYIDQSYYTTILNRGNITAGYSGPIHLVEATGATVFNQGIIAAQSRSSVRGIDFYGGKQNHVINGKSGQISARNDTIYGDTAQDLAITNRGVFPGSASYAIIFGQNIYNMAGGTIRGFQNTICANSNATYCGTHSNSFEVVNYGYVSGSIADSYNGTATVVAHKGGFIDMYNGAVECPNYLQSPNGETITSSIATNENVDCTINTLPTIDLSDSSVNQYNMSGTINQSNKPYAEITNPANHTSTGLSLATTNYPLRGYRLDNQGSIDQTSTNVALDLSYTDIGVIDNGPGVTTDSSLYLNGIAASTPLGRPSCTAMVAAAPTSDQSGGACSANAATVTNSLTSGSTITSAQSSAIKAQYAARLDIVNEPGGLIQSGANGASTQAVDKTIDVYRSSGLMIENQGGTIAATGQNAISAPYSEYLHIKNTTAVTQGSSGDIDGVVMGAIQAAEQAITLTRTNQDDPATDDSYNPNKLTLGFNGVAGKNLPGNTPQATVGGDEYPNGFSQTSFAAITNSGMITALSNTIRATGVQYATIDNLNPVDFNGKPLQNEGAPVVASITATDGDTAIDASYAQYVDIVNEGTISATNSTTINLGYADAIRVKNSGTISTTGSYALNAAGESSNVLIDNSATGTIKADSIQAIYLQGASQAAVQNQGTITANAYGVYEVDGHFVSISNGDSSNTSSTPATIEAESAYAIYSSGEYTDIINYQNGVIQAPEDTINVGDYARIDNYGSIAASDGNAAAITGGQFSHVINEDGATITGNVTLGDYSTFEDKSTTSGTSTAIDNRTTTGSRNTVSLGENSTVVLSGTGSVGLSDNIEGKGLTLQVGSSEVACTGVTTLTDASIDLAHSGMFTSLITSRCGSIDNSTFTYQRGVHFKNYLHRVTNGSGNSITADAVTQSQPFVVGPTIATTNITNSSLGRVVVLGEDQNVTLANTEISLGVGAFARNASIAITAPEKLGSASHLRNHGTDNTLDIQYTPAAGSSILSISTAGSTKPWAAVTNSLGYPIYYNFENACIQSTQDGCITAVNGAGLLEIRDEKLAMHTTRLAELLQSEATGWTHNVRYQDHQEQDDGHPHYNATIMSLAKRWDQGDKKWLIALDQDNTHIRDNFNVSQTTLSVGMQKPWKKHTTWHALAGLSREQTTRITQETLGASSYDKASFNAGFVGVGAGVTKAVNSKVQVGGDLGLIHEMVASYEESRYGWDTNHLTLLKPEAYARLAYRLANGIRLDHELRSFYATMVGGDSQTFYVLGNAQTHDYRNTDTWTLQYSLGAQVAKTMRVAASAAWSNQDFTQIGLSVQMN